MPPDAKQGDLLLIIDLQNAYAADGAWACEGSEEVCSRLCRLLESGWAEKTGTRVMFTQFLAPEHPQGVWQQYNVVNAEVNTDLHANALMPQIAELARKHGVYTKSVYSSLEVPEIRMAAQSARRVAVAGVVAECCVLSTAMALIDAGCNVVWLTDCIAGENREKAKACEFILEGLSYLHITMQTLEEFAAQA